MIDLGSPSSNGGSVKEIEGKGTFLETDDTLPVHIPAQFHPLPDALYPSYPLGPLDIA